MGKPSELDLEKVKPSARKRAALTRDSRARVRKTRQYASAATSVLRTENPGLLQPEHELEETFKIKQRDIRQELDQSTAWKAAFSLDLADSGLSPYICSVYSRSSRSLLIASKKGHVAVTSWREASLQAEIFLNETVRSATFLHNDAFFATAQRKYAYIYDSSGAEVHVLRTHREPGCMQFLPHHLLLATASAPCAPHGKLTYTDTSTGEVIGELDYGGRPLRLGNAMGSSLNYLNGIVHLGHSNGVVSLWSPVASRPLARIFTHAGGVRHVEVSRDGLWMATAGADSTLKVWDLRTYKMTASWKIPSQTTALTVSQRGLIGLSFGATVQVWAPQGKNRTFGGGTNNGWGRNPYMIETHAGKRITGLEFCPYEDMLAVCHETGMKTMVIPGAGEATFDSRAPNPYETRKQRRENEVRILLDKLAPATIALDPSFVGGVDKDPSARLEEIRERVRVANDKKRVSKADVKRAKGRNKISKRLARKQANIIDAKKLELQEKLDEEQKTLEAAKHIKEKHLADAAAGIRDGGATGPVVPDALRRFFPKEK